MRAMWSSLSEKLDYDLQVFKVLSGLHWPETLNMAMPLIKLRPARFCDELKRRSLLLINQSLCDHDEWNEALIDQRGADLAKRVMRTWPGLDAESWPMAEAAETSAAGA